jgi:hypothetical protein
MWGCVPTPLLISVAPLPLLGHVSAPLPRPGLVAAPRYSPTAISFPGLARAHHRGHPLPWCTAKIFAGHRAAWTEAERRLSALTTAAGDEAVALHV